MDTPSMTDQRATDGNMLPAAQNLAQLLAMLDEGDLLHEASRDLRELVSTMTNHMIEHGGPVKGEMSLKIKFSLDKGVFSLGGEHKVTAPKSPRGKTIMWTDGKGNLTLHNPKQYQMFGSVRDVSDPSASDIRSA
jgi:hypothetical protein